MTAWLPDSLLEVETFILRDTKVVDLEAFAAQHEKYLVPTSTHPREAATWWRWQADKTDPGEGWVSMKLDGEQITPLEAWTNVAYFWNDVLNVLADYLTQGRGSAGFSGELAEFSLTQKGPVAIFSLRGFRHPVEPSSFCRCLLTAARGFHEWMDEYVGSFDPSWMSRIDALANRLAS